MHQFVDIHEYMYVSMCCMYEHVNTCTPTYVEIDEFLCEYTTVLKYPWMGDVHVGFVCTRI